MKHPLLTFTPEGIFCRQGNFFIDPSKPVKDAIITHAHSDHARFGHKNYLAHQQSLPILYQRLGEINVSGVRYNETISKNGVNISLHPAGHIVGSSQVRVEYKGEVWCVSGDYKTTPDPIAQNFEPVRCHTFITETTFGLPIFQWPDERSVIEQIESWWQENQSKGKVSLISAYALGKAQRILSCIDTSVGPIYCHGAVDVINKLHVDLGFLEDKFPHLSTQISKEKLVGSLVIAPPSAIGSSWVKRLGSVSVGMASGWMMLRGSKRRQNVDRGFVLSDHSDWQGLNDAIDATSAERVICMHGYSDTFSRWLNHRGYRAESENTLVEHDSKPDSE